MRLLMRHKRTVRKLGWRIGAAAAVVLIIAAPGGEPQPAGADPAAIAVIWGLMLEWQVLATLGIMATTAGYFWFERKRLTRE